MLRLQGETDELKRRARAQVTAIDLLENVSDPSSPGARLSQNGSGRYQRAEITADHRVSRLPS
jgi:ribulose-bisphosphate carboxylase large chain